MCKAVSIFHAVFLLHGGRPKLFGIAVGMDQKDSFYVHTLVVFTGAVLGRCSRARFGVRQWWLPVVSGVEGDFRHQGGEGVAGSPGVSLAGDVPTKLGACIVGSCGDTHVVHSRPHHNHHRLNQVCDRAVFFFCSHV